MPAPAPDLGETAAARLAAVGARLRAHRKALRVSATAAAEAAGMARRTWHRIEAGEPSVTAGAYMAAIIALGLDVALIDPRAQPAARTRKPLPRRIRLGDYPQLKRLAWQRADVTTATITAKDALALYERNWRHVDREAMDDRERELVARLVEDLGAGRLLV